MKNGGKNKSVAFIFLFSVFMSAYNNQCIEPIPHPTLLFFDNLLHLDIWHKMEEKICPYFHFIVTLGNKVQEAVQKNNIDFWIFGCEISNSHTKFDKLWASFTKYEQKELLYKEFTKQF